MSRRRTLFPMTQCHSSTWRVVMCQWPPTQPREQYSFFVRNPLTRVVTLKKWKATRSSWCTSKRHPCFIWTMDSLKRIRDRLIIWPNQVFWVTKASNTQNSGLRMSILSSFKNWMILILRYQRIKGFRILKAAFLEKIWKSSRKSIFARIMRRSLKVHWTSTTK